jgi:hypothetical protein
MWCLGKHTIPGRTFLPIACVAWSPPWPQIHLLQLNNFTSESLEAIGLRIVCLPTQKRAEKRLNMKERGIFLVLQIFLRISIHFQARGESYISFWEMKSGPSMAQGPSYLSSHSLMLRSSVSWHHVLDHMNFNEQTTQIGSEQKRTVWPCKRHFTNA